MVVAYRPYIILAQIVPPKSCSNCFVNAPIWARKLLLLGVMISNLTMTLRSCSSPVVCGSSACLQCFVLTRSRPSLVLRVKFLFTSVFLREVVLDSTTPFQTVLDRISY